MMGIPTQDQLLSLMKRKVETLITFWRGEYSSIDMVYREFLEMKSYEQIAFISAITMEEKDELFKRSLTNACWR